MQVFPALSVITQVISILNGIWRHHLLFNKVSQNSCPLILDNNHSEFSVICVRFMYKYLALCYFFLFNRTPFVCFKDISCFTCKQIRNKLVELVERWQRYLTGWDVWSRTLLFVVMTETSYYSNRYFISVLKTKDMWFKHKYQLCLNY